VLKNVSEKLFSLIIKQLRFFLQKNLDGIRSMHYNCINKSQRKHSKRTATLLGSLTSWITSQVTAVGRETETIL